VIYQYSAGASTPCCATSVKERGKSMIGNTVGILQKYELAEITLSEYLWHNLLLEDLV